MPGDHLRSNPGIWFQEQKSRVFLQGKIWQEQEIFFKSSPGRIVYG